MAREEITRVTCDKCKIKTTVVDSAYESLVTDKIEKLGWLITTETDICPECKANLSPEELDTIL